MDILPIFPQAVIGLNKLKIDSSKVLKDIESLEFEMTDKTIDGESLCYISKNMRIFENFNYLKNEIFENVKNYLNNIMKLKMNFKFTSSWVMKTPFNGYSHKHFHSNSFLSGVYYPKGDKNFNIKFYKDIHVWDIEIEEINNLNSEWYTFNIVEDNVLILFPSHLEHSIGKNLSKNYRYSIAFNVLPLGEIGSGDNKINFK
jgi:uncharacterized protein (TIGR02466 family)